MNNTIKANRERLSAIRREMLRSGKMSFNSALAIEASEIEQDLRDANSAITTFRIKKYSIGGYTNALTNHKPITRWYELLINRTIHIIKAIVTGDKI